MKMLTLSDEARNGFLSLSHNSYLNGLISWNEFLSRIGVLNSLCKEDKVYENYSGLTEDKHNISKEINEEISEREWLIQHQSKDTGARTTSQQGELEKPSNLDVLALLHQGKWKFIKSDPDPLPSVPHGHDSAKHTQNLHAYLGIVYDKTKPINRVSRQEIIQLWNNDKFRVFAREAIDNFIANNPGFNWKINNPKRLPRKR